MEIGSLDTQDENEITRALLKKYQGVFSREGKQCMEGVEHRLDLSDSTPIRERPYKTDMKSQEIIDQTVEQLLEEGIIIESDSNWSSPVLLVKKKTGDMRLCVDYRAVNKVLGRDE